MKKITALLLLGVACPAVAQLEGMIDFHVHSAPDSRARSIDAFETARMARRHGMRALLFKNHYTHTASLAYLVAQAVPGIEVYGGIALNRSVGGVNPIAVEHMANTTGGLGRVVWMPTYDSEHDHLTVTPNPYYVPVSTNGELLPAVHDVLAIVAERELVLATGHSSPEESLLLIRAARAIGIDRIIVTHPTSLLVLMSPEIQKQAVALGALLEYPLGVAVPNAAYTFEEFAAQIREVGPENVVLSSDLGQVGNPVHTDGFMAFLPRFKAAGYSQAEIDVMTKDNPARLLGLE